MEFDIIDASEVDRFKDRKRGDLDTEEETKDQKLDILDDPVRMYLKQMGQVPLLTREQEVEISKRIEDAEIEFRNTFTFSASPPSGYLALADKLMRGKERFDRVILDKKIESRERYMKALPKLCDQVRSTPRGNHRHYSRSFRPRHPVAKRNLRPLSPRTSRSISRLYSRYYFKQKVIEDLCDVVGDYQEKIWKYSRKKRRRSRNRDSSELSARSRGTTWNNSKRPIPES